MIVDFAGMKYFLNLMGLHEKECFWSTIDLAEYCIGGKDFDDIKIRSIHEEKIVYSRFHALHRQDEYVKLGAGEVLGKFETWMHETAASAESGDVINIIMIAHGDPSPGESQGTLQLGTSWLEPSHLRDIMKKFKDGVQVNFVTNACGSGGICRAFSAEDQQNRLIIAAAGPSQSSSGNGMVGWVKGLSPSGRFRSSYFMDVIIKSLGKLNLDGIGPKLATLGQDLTANVHTNPEPDQAKSNPQMDGDTARQASLNLQQVLHFDYVDFPRDPTPSSRFLRQESKYQIVLQQSTDDIDEWGFGNCHRDVEDLFKAEVQKSDDGHAYLQGDAELWARMSRVLNQNQKGPRSKIGDILKALELRARIQSSFFAVFLYLNDLCLVTFEGLQSPIALDGRNDDKDIASLVAVLGCFSEIKKYAGRDWADSFGFDTFFEEVPGYTTPLWWLATLIVRGAVVKDFDLILERIEGLAEFGSLDRQKAERLWPKEKKLVRNLSAGLAKPSTGNRDSSVVAFWLPHNLGPELTLEIIYQSFDRKHFIPMEQLFFRFFNIPEDETSPHEQLSASFLEKMIGEGNLC